MDSRFRGNDGGWGVRGTEGEAFAGMTGWASAEMSLPFRSYLTHTKETLNNCLRSS